MYLTRGQAQVLMKKFINRNINQHDQMADPINYTLRSFEGNINSEYPTGFKLQFQVTKEMDKYSKYSLNQLIISARVSL